MLGESLSPRVAAAGCARAGRQQAGRRILDRLAPAWPGAVVAEARATLQGAMSSESDELSVLRWAGFPRSRALVPELCPRLLDRWPDDAQLQARCVAIGGWPP